jgi:hypothetical protein
MKPTESRTDDIDRALASMKAQIGSARPDSQGKMRSWSAGRVIRAALIGVISLLAPFLLLVKVAVALHLEASVDPWAALLAAALTTTILLTVLTMAVSYRVRRRFAVSSFTFRSNGLLVIAYCLYSILFISGANVKSAEVATTYRALHPLLRLSVSTLLIADSDLVVTDAARTIDDYARMGLPASERSLHFEQSTGYVHAVDLRTVGRTSLRNAAVAAYFRLMGFHTLRHVGTADHLHVSLPVR